MTKKQKALYAERMTTILAEHGAEPDTASGYELKLETTAGTLCASVHDTWVAMRFDDARRAWSTVGVGAQLNIYSGKYNVQDGIGGPARGDSFDAWLAAQESALRRMLDPIESKT